MQAGTRGGATQREAELLATPGARGVIGRGQGEAQHPDDRRQAAFRLPQGPGEDEPERQRGFDRNTRSEYGRCPPRVPPPTASHAAIASGANHTGIAPRWTSARSYAGQCPTGYVVVYCGCTLDVMSRSCTCGRHDGQEVDRGAPRAAGVPCTNAVRRPQEMSPDPEEIQHESVDREKPLRVRSGFEPAQVSRAVPCRLMRHFDAIVRIRGWAVQDRRDQGTAGGLIARQRVAARQSRRDWTRLSRTSPA